MGNIDGFMELATVIGRKPEEPAETSQAVVSRIDSEGTVWVRLEGADGETPVHECLASVKPGDSVPVRIAKGRASVSANKTDVPASTSTAAGIGQVAMDALNSSATASSAAASALQSADTAKQAADSAQQSLKSVVQGATTVEKAVSVMQTALEAVVDYDPLTDTTQEWFWHDANGAHVLGDTSGYRNDVTSSGMEIVEVASEDSVAQFGASGAQVGRSGESHLNLDYHSLQLIDKEGNTYFHVSDLRGLDGKAEITQSWLSTGATVQSGVLRYDLSLSATNTNYSVVVKDDDDNDVTSSYEINKYTTYVTVRYGLQSNTVMTAVYETDSDEAKAFTFGTRVVNSGIGAFSVSEGIENKSEGAYSHAEGWLTRARGTASHSEGRGTYASGDYAHAEGLNTTAIQYSHAEGSAAKAEGFYSHAQNRGTIAQRASQTALGEFNIKDTVGDGPIYQGEYAVIIGNGTADNARSNALTTDWDGRAKLWHPEIIRGTAPASNIYGGGGAVQLVDKNGAQIGFLQPVQYANGTEGIQLGVGNSDASDYNTLQLAYDASDNATVSVANQTAWRNALGAASGIWPVSAGGTGTDKYLSGGVVDEINSSSNLAVSTGAWKSGSSSNNPDKFTLTAGTYIAIIHTEWASNSTGARMHCLSTTNPNTSGFSTPSNSASTGMQAAAGTVRMTTMNFLSPSSSTDYYLGLYQNSGGNLNCTARRVRVIQLA